MLYYNIIYMSKIPKIIHQLWIGNKPPPTKFMDTRKENNGLKILSILDGPKKK